MPADARAFPRSPCQLPATADGPRGPVRGTCTNVSLGGLFLEAVQLPLGTMTTVAVEHPSLGRFTAQAEVRRHSTSPHGMGLQFTRLEPAQLAALHRLLGVAG